MTGVCDQHSQAEKEPWLSPPLPSRPLFCSRPWGQPETHGQDTPPPPTSSHETHLSLDNVLLNRLFILE